MASTQDQLASSVWSDSLTSSETQAHVVKIWEARQGNLRGIWDVIGFLFFTGLGVWHLLLRLFLPDILTDAMDKLWGCLPWPMFLIVIFSVVFMLWTLVKLLFSMIREMKRWVVDELWPYMQRIVARRTELWPYIARRIVGTGSTDFDPILRRNSTTATNLRRGNSLSSTAIRFQQNNGAPLPHNSANTSTSNININSQVPVTTAPVPPAPVAPVPPAPGNEGNGTTFAQALTCLFYLFAAVFVFFLFLVSLKTYNTQYQSSRSHGDSGHGTTHYAPSASIASSIDDTSGILAKSVRAVTSIPSSSVGVTDSYSVKNTAQSTQTPTPNIIVRLWDYRTSKVGHDVPSVWKIGVTPVWDELIERFHASTSSVSSNMDMKSMKSAVAATVNQAASSHGSRYVRSHSEEAKKEFSSFIKTGSSFDPKNIKETEKKQSGSSYSPRKIEDITAEAASSHGSSHVRSPSEEATKKTSSFAKTGSSFVPKDTKETEKKQSGSSYSPVSYLPGSSYPPGSSYSRSKIDDITDKAASSSAAASSATSSMLDSGTSWGNKAATSVTGDVKDLYGTASNEGKKATENVLEQDTWIGLYVDKIINLWGNGGSPVKSGPMPANISASDSTTASVAKSTTEATKNLDSKIPSSFRPESYSSAPQSATGEAEKLESTIPSTSTASSDYFDFTHTPSQDEPEGILQQVSNFFNNPRKSASDANSGNSCFESSCAKSFYRTIASILLLTGTVYAAAAVRKFIKESRYFAGPWTLMAYSPVAWLIIASGHHFLAYDHVARLLAIAGHAWKYNKFFFFFLTLASLKYVKALVHFISYTLYNKAAPHVEVPTTLPRDVCVIMNVTGDIEQAEFQTNLQSILANRPGLIRIAVVGLAAQQRANRVLSSLPNAIRGQTNVEVYNKGLEDERVALLAALESVDSHIVSITDDKTSWPETYLSYALREFENPHVGVVGTSRVASRIRSQVREVNFWNYVLNYHMQRQNYENTATYNIDGGVACISSSSLLVKWEILASHLFRQQFLREKFPFWNWNILNIFHQQPNFRIGTDTLEPGWDYNITRYCSKMGWKTVFRNDAETRVGLTSVGVETKNSSVTERAFEQLIHEAKVEWRSTLTTLFTDSECWSSQPWTTYAVFLTSLINFSLFYDPLMLILLWFSAPSTSAYFCGAIGTMFIIKLVKAAYRLEALADLPYAFYSVLFGYLHSYFKLVGLLNICNVTSLGESDDMDRARTRNNIPITVSSNRRVPPRVDSPGGFRPNGDLDGLVRDAPARNSGPFATVVTEMPAVMSGGLITPAKTPSRRPRR